MSEAAAWFEAGTKRMKPVTLEGRFVRLVPMERGQIQALTRAGADPGLWQWYPVAPLLGVDAMGAHVEKALADWEAGRLLPFVIQDRATGEVLGSTRFMALEPAHRRLEIGATWLTPARQGTQANPEAKLLLLRYAFEVMGCARVEFKTDALNARSRAALRKLGAKEEGILRNHMVTASGRLRDSVYFSILPEEWPAVRAGLEARLQP
jgi:RimJ/RimL family protein N-acetyltransferase